MKVLIDTDIILDVLCNRPGRREGAERLFKLCEIKKMTGVISALSISHIACLMQRELDPESIRRVLEALALIFEITELKPGDLKKAAGTDFRDFEAAIQGAVAARIGADHIVTDRPESFAGSQVAAVSPRELPDAL
ncbi:MAG: PIN domain-containing protein [Oscillospiraceae bacterium]|nr:PIN domain-containing protein [Oscillospiraceae bacterium]